MNRPAILAILVLVTFAASGCGDAPQATPEATFASAQKALAAKNLDALIDLMPPSRLARQKEVFERTKADKDAAMTAMHLGVEPEELKAMTFREFGRRLLKNGLDEEPEYVAGFVTAKVEDVKIEGDSATITTTIGDRKVGIPLAKEGERWYVARLIN